MNAQNLPAATGCECKCCKPTDAKIALQLALARTDNARQSPKFYPGAAGNHIEIYCTDYDLLRAAVAAMAELIEAAKDADEAMGCLHFGESEGSAAHYRLRAALAQVSP